MSKSTKFINQSECCYGCGSCAVRCPQNCIAMNPNAEGFLYPEIDFDRCANCGRCSGNCPVNTAALHQRPDIKQKFLKIVPRLPELQRADALDSVFLALSDAILRRNGAVVGPMRGKDFEVTHHFATTPAERDKITTFTYLLSRVTPVYGRIQKHLKSGALLLFVGTPCQIAGLYAYLGQKYTNLITLEILCRGKASPLVLEGYTAMLRECYGSEPVNIERCAPLPDSVMTPILRITLANGEIHWLPRGEDPFVQLFDSRLVLRPSCGQCAFAKPDREADLSLAVSPGAPGETILVINTDQGFELFTEVAEAFDSHSFTPDEELAAMLFAPRRNHPDRGAFFNAFRRDGFAEVARRYAGKRPLHRKLRTGIWKTLRRLLGHTN